MDALTPYLHGGALALLLLSAAALARPGTGTGSRLWGALFGLSVAAYVVRAAPTLAVAFGPISEIAWLLSAVSTALFLLFARALLIDRPAGASWADWPGLALLGAFATLALCGAWLPQPPAGLFWVAHQVLEFLCYGYVLWLVVAGWREDLDEDRRRIRGPLAAVIAVYGVMQGVFESWGFMAERPGPYDFWEAAALAAVAFGVPLFILQTRWDRIAPAPATDARSAATTERGLDAADRLELDRVLAIVDGAKAYREEGLTITVLAERVRIPEHRLRRLINGGLGFRNYAAFLNARRIAEAKERLAAPAQARTPILTLALDLGYGSVGPFNRAFKEATGVTPTEFRRAALAPKAE